MACRRVGGQGGRMFSEKQQAPGQGGKRVCVRGRGLYRRVLAILPGRGSTRKMTPRANAVASSNTTSIQSQIRATLQDYQLFNSNVAHQCTAATLTAAAAGTTLEAWAGAAGSLTGLGSCPPRAAGRAAGGRGGSPSGWAAPAAPAGSTPASTPCTAASRPLQAGQGAHIARAVQERRKGEEVQVTQRAASWTAPWVDRIRNCWCSRRG